MTQSASNAWLQRLPRFSLRTGLILFLVLGVGLGLLSRWIQDVRVRGEAQRALFEKPANEADYGKENVRVLYATEIEQSWFADGVRRLVHPEYDRKFDWLAVGGTEPSEETATNIASVFGLQALECDGKFSTDWLVKAVSARGLKSLLLNVSLTPSNTAQKLDLISPPSDLEYLDFSRNAGEIRPEFVHWLCRSPKLHKVSFDSGLTIRFARWFGTTSSLPAVDEFKLHVNQIEQRASLEWRSRVITHRWEGATQCLLEGLLQREDLKHLRIHSAILLDPIAITKFCEQSNVEELHLQNCDVSRESLQELAKLKHLRVLHLDWTPILGEDVEVLANIKTLREIDGLWCNDDEAFEALKAKLPNCKITPHGERSLPDSSKEL